MGRCSFMVRKVDGRVSLSALDIRVDSVHNYTFAWGN